MVEKFEKKGVLIDCRKEREKRDKKVCTPENIQRVKEYFAQNPRDSLRKTAQVLDISYSSLRFIARKAIKLYPYKITGVHRISDEAKEARKAFCANILGIENGETFPVQQTIFTDEAHFWMDGYVNSQNYRFWGTEPPNEYSDVSLHPKKVTAWAAFCSKGIFVKIFTDTVTGERYRKLLLEEWLPFANNHQVVTDWYFMQDGAPPHGTNAVFDVLNSAYENRVIAYQYPDRMGSGMDWPPYSPDLNPCDYFLWGYVKDRVYANKITNTDQLTASILSVINSIDKDMRDRVLDNFYKRIELCYNADGGHFEKHK